MYLGINAYHHDAGAALVNEKGKIIAAAQEERFSRKKREERFPVESIRYCLQKGNISINDLKGIAFAWDPWLSFYQRLWLNLFIFPASISRIRDDLGKVWKILSIPRLLRKDFDLNSRKVRFKYFRHHMCHAASAYYASSFQRAAFLTIDGHGELESSTWGRCENEKMYQLGKCYYPNSIGKVYSTACTHLGFWGAEKEGTTMALAAFGQPTYLDTYRKILQISKNKNSLEVNVDTSYFDIPTRTLKHIFGKPRTYAEEITSTHKDIAASVQKRTEEVIIELLERLHAITNETNLVLGGGVALNSVLNGKIENISSFNKVFIQPAANDSGVCLGAAYLLAHADRNDMPPHTMMSAALGPSFTSDEYKYAISKAGLSYLESKDIAKETATLIAEGKVVAWFQGRMEFGPRALGMRSLLCDARQKYMIDRLNKVKKRERFRPFAISILEDKAPLVLDNITDSPFMLMVDTVKEEWKRKIPSAQHVDGSVRIQTVNAKRDGLYYDLIQHFYDFTGVPLIINTSLNVKGEPIVCTPDEAIHTFKSSEIDVLVMGQYLIKKENHELNAPLS